MNRLEKAFEEVLLAMKLDLDDENLKGTPKRLAKMYTNELFKGVYEVPPEIVSFPNTGGSCFLYTKVPFTSTCAHHFQPVKGVAHLFVDYSSCKEVIGLSKFNRIVEHFAAKPTLQEDLSHEVLEYLKAKLNTDKVGVILQGEHGCVTGRGVCASFSDTITEMYGSPDDSVFQNTCRMYFNK